MSDRPQPLIELNAETNPFLNELRAIQQSTLNAKQPFGIENYAELPPLEKYVAIAAVVQRVNELEKEAEIGKADPRLLNRLVVAAAGPLEKERRRLVTQHPELSQDGLTPAEVRMEDNLIAELVRRRQPQTDEQLGEPRVVAAAGSLGEKPQKITHFESSEVSAEAIKPSRLPEQAVKELQTIMGYIRQENEQLPDYYSKNKNPLSSSVILEDIKEFFNSAQEMPDRNAWIEAVRAASQDVQPEQAKYYEMLGNLAHTVTHAPAPEKEASHGR